MTGDDAQGWSNLGVDALTRDGAVAQIRPVQPDDADALVRLHTGIGPDALRYRFFSSNRQAAEAYARHLLEDAPGTACLVAIVDGRLVGAASLEPVQEGVAEVALLVSDDQHQRGLGSLLLEHLADVARERGVRRFVADVLDDNRLMREVFRDAGFVTDVRFRGGVASVTVDLTPTSQLLEAEDLREEEAERHSLAAALRPRSVVVLGVRRDGSGLGAALVRAVVAGGYSGELHVVHPVATEVAGVPAVRSCAALTTPADLAVVAVPPTSVLEAVDDAARGGVRAAVVVTSGFSEMGAEGVQLQAQLVARCRRHSIRLIGPNCLGLLTRLDGSVLNATFADVRPLPGDVAVASQSGGVGIVLLEAAARAGLGVGTFVSLGNKADVSGNDLLAAWRLDPAVSAACLYLESFGNGHKFSRVARRFSRTKPLLAVVGGRSEGGRRAGASHTAAAASPAVAMDALLDHSGVVTCHGADDMVTTALLLEQQTLPTGNRVGIVTNAGGMGVLAADRAAGAGLRVPHLSESVGGQLVAALSASAGWSNPVDTGAGAGVDQLVEAVRVVTTSQEVDCALVVLVATTMLDTGAVVAALEQMRRTHHGVPAALVVLGDDRPASVGVEGFTVMPDVEHAVLALGRAARRAAWLESPRADPAVDLVRQGRARRRLHELCPPGGGRWLSFDETAELLREYGLDLVGETAVGSAAACEVARTTGFPVALKVAAAGVHKSDLGYVAVGLDDEQSVARVVDGWARQGGGPVEVLVQPMARGVEVAVGLVRDPAVGGLVMIAAGGVDIDVWDDRAFLLAPVTPSEVEAALRSLKVWTLLRGHRGAPAASVESLVEVVRAVARIADELPDVAELDLNPVVVSPSGASLVDARLRVDATRAPRDAPALRRPAPAAADGT